MSEDESKTKERLLIELPALRREIAEPRESDMDTTHAKELPQESERRYRELADLLPETVVEFDQNCNVTFANLDGLEKFGYTKQDLDMGLNIFQTVAPEDHSRMKENIAKILRGDKSGGNEYTMMKKDGSLFPALIHGSPIIRDNKIAGLRAIVVDITDRKKAEKQLLESERMSRATIDALSTTLCVVDEEGTILDVNRAWRKFADANPPVPPDYALGMNYLSLCDNATGPNSEEAAPFAAGIREIVKGGIDEFSLEYPCHSSEEERWFTGRVTRFPGDAPLRLAITHEDITQRKRAEGELREREAFLNTLLDAIPIPVFYKDRDGRYQGFNRAFEAFFGATEKGLIGKTVFDVNPPDLAEIYQAKDTELMESGGVQRYESQMKDAHGLIRDVIFNKAAFTDSRGTVTGLIGAILDITDRKRAEKEKEDLESRLLQAQKMEAIGTLAGGIAHDFNNILAAIIGFTEMVLDETPPESSAYRHLGLVLKSGMRGRDLVRQILAFSRKTDYERNPLSLSSIVNETAKMLRASLPATIEVRVNIVPASDMVRANPTEIQQIIMNLCTNAAHAMAERGGQLSIELADCDVEPGSPFESTLAPGAYVQLTVKDTGTGMDAKVMKRIFEPFFTTKEVGQGTGMGLAVTYGIVKSLKGEITVRSSRKTGTVFRVLLPKVSPETPSEHPVEDIPRGKERILFVDDEEVLANLGKTMLEKLGYKVTATTDGAKALKSFSRNPSRFDLVFTDQTMPEIPGLNLAQKLLKLRPDIPIILCTGHSDAVSPEIAKEAGIRGFLMKPLATREVAEAVRRVLDADKETIP